jgi:hypothetical protein
MAGIKLYSMQIGTYSEKRMKRGRHFWGRTTHLGAGLKQKKSPRLSAGVQHAQTAMKKNQTVSPGAGFGH